MFPEKLSGTETCGRDPPSIIIEIIISFPHLQSPRSNQQEKDLDMSCLGSSDGLTIASRIPRTRQ